MFSFIWQKKREWLARASVTLRAALGGLGVVDVQSKLSTLHVLWIKRYMLHQDLPWASFFKDAPVPGLLGSFNPPDPLPRCSAKIRYGCSATFLSQHLAILVFSIP